MVNPITFNPIKGYTPMYFMDYNNIICYPMYFQPLYENEVFKIIDDSIIPDIKENTYMISSYGRVWSIISNRFIIPEIDKDGYYRYGLYNKFKKQKHYLSHRITLIAFGYNNPDNARISQVNHINGNKRFNLPSNLEWCSLYENVAHAVENGLRGTTSTISRELAFKIGEYLATRKYTQDQISDILGVSKYIVKHISAGETYREVYDYYNLGTKPVNDIYDKIGELLSLRKYTYKQISEMTNTSIHTIKHINLGHFHKEIYEKYNLGKHHSKD